DAAADEGVGDVGGEGGALGLVLYVAGGRRPVGLAAGGVGVAKQPGARAPPAPTGAAEVAPGPPRPWGSVGEREVAAAQEAGDGLGVVAVALGLGAMHGFHGPGVAEHEGDVLLAAGVGQPLPAVHARAADDQALAEGLDGFEEGRRGGGQVA